MTALFALILAAWHEAETRCAYFARQWGAAMERERLNERHPAIEEMRAYTREAYSRPHGPQWEHEC